MTAPVRSIATRAAILTGAFALSTFAVPGVAYAAPGSIKIVDVDNPKNNGNDPTVCRFRIDADHFTSADDGSLRYGINPEGQTGQPTPPFVRSGDIPVNAAGDGQSGIITLPDGQYKVFVQNAQNDAAISNGGSKKKVFKVNCPANPGQPTPTPTPTPGGGGDNGGVGGAGGPTDNGESPVGGVDTGGGGAAGGDGSTVPLLMLSGAGAAAVALGAKRFRKSG
ncbi:MAG TPA: hypothetical protein VMZ00_12705 [Sporichthya sp.]|nr:hypothetical protein [Sporichthya sp.]